jgi:hypothetical protein
LAVCGYGLGRVQSKKKKEEKKLFPSRCIGIPLLFTLQPQTGVPLFMHGNIVMVLLDDTVLAMQDCLLHDGIKDRLELLARTNRISPAG